MVPRYTRPEMAAIWSPEERFRIWFEIEALAAEAMAAIGTVPPEAARAIRERGAPRAAAITEADVARIDEIERTTRHDVIAFLTWMAESIGEPARFMHQGMTSSDVLDTCLAVQMTRAADLLLSDLDALLAALKKRAHRAPPYTPPSAAPTASTPNPPPSASSSPATTPSSPATAPGSPPRAPRSPPARSPARSAPSPASTRGSKPLSPDASACASSRSARR